MLRLRLEGVEGYHPGRSRGRDSERDRESSVDRSRDASRDRRTERFRIQWPNFNKDTTLKKFLKQTDEMFELTNFSDKEKILQIRSLVPQKLKDFMLTSSQLQPVLRTDYELFKEFFIQNYDGYNPSKDFVTYNCIKQLVSESVVEYSVRLKDAFFNAFPGYPDNIVDDTLSRKFIETLYYQNEIAYKLKDHNRDDYINFNKLVKAALIYETNFNEQKGHGTNFYANSISSADIYAEKEAHSLAYFRPQTQFRTLSMDEALDSIYQILGQTRPINPYHKSRLSSNPPARSFRRPVSSNFRGRFPVPRVVYPAPSRPPLTPTVGGARGRAPVRRPFRGRSFSRSAPSRGAVVPGLNPSNRPPLSSRGRFRPMRGRGRSFRRPFRARSNPTPVSNARPINISNRVNPTSTPRAASKAPKRARDLVDYSTSEGPATSRPRNLFSSCEPRTQNEGNWDGNHFEDSFEPVDYDFDDYDYYQPDETLYELQYLGENADEIFYTDGQNYLAYPRENYTTEEFEADDEGEEEEEEEIDVDSFYVQQTEHDEENLTDNYHQVGLESDKPSPTERTVA